jgi:PAS domain S-box-containing protein
MALYLAGERTEKGRRPGLLRLSVLLPLVTLAAILLPAGTLWLLTTATTEEIREVVVQGDEETALRIDQELELLSTRAIAALAGLAIVGTGLAVYFTLRHVRRLQFLTEVASHLAGPGREVRVTSGRSREVRDLARAMDRLAEKIAAERRRAANAERRYRTLLETMTEGFVIVDPQERIIYANRRFAEMLGVSLDRLEGQDVLEFLDEENRKRLAQQSTARKKGQPGRYELEWHRADGSSLTTIVSAAAIRDVRGGFTGSFAVVTDITERRRLEEQMSRAERLRALGQLAGGIAHDFNNRLTAILGNAQLLLLDVEDESIASALTTIERAALEGAETVRRIMDFTRTRPDAARESIEPKTFLEEVMGLLRFRWKDEADEGGYAYRILPEHRATGRIDGYPTELREALLNLMNNAFDAMPGGGELRVTTFDHPKGVGIRIADSGHGMSAETLNQACDPFFTTRGLNATGLGLSITHSIIQRHGGNLSMQSAVGRGTTVTLVLPTAGDDVPRREAGILAGPPEDARSARILVVEDEEGIARLMKLTLSRSGHVVETANSGEEAMEILRTGRRFDLVVTDLGMPGMPGDQVAEEVKRRQPGAKIVVVTGWGSEAEEMLATVPSVDLLVKKPFSVSDLVEKIEGVLGVDQGTSAR